MQKTYATFTVVDFVCNDDFLQHHVAPTVESEQFWKQWITQHPQRQADWVLACQLIDSVQAGLSEYSQTYLSEEDEAWLLARILATRRQARLSLKARSLWQHAWVYRAAAACLLLAVGYRLVRSQLNKPSVYQRQMARLVTPPVDKANLTRHPQLVKLSDGSTVLLAAQSQLSYPTDYGQQNRTVFLQGEATFDVAKDARNPFVVYAGEVVTRVLGTRFVVRSFERDPNVVVTVREGHVSVFKSEPTDNAVKPDKTLLGMLLCPNQQAVFSRETGTFAKALVALPQRIDSQQRVPDSFIFSETPVNTVFEKLEKAYGIDIVYNADVLRDCQLTASLTHESLFQKLDVIVESINATYEVVDGQVVITAKGCGVN